MTSQLCHNAARILSETVAEKCDCRQKRRDNGEIRQLSHFSATVSLFCDKLSHFSATVWTGFWATSPTTTSLCQRCSPTFGGTGSMQCWSTDDWRRLHWSTTGSPCCRRICGRVTQCWLVCTLGRSELDWTQQPDSLNMKRLSTHSNYAQIFGSGTGLLILLCSSCCSCCFCWGNLFKKP